MQRSELDKVRLESSSASSLSDSDDDPESDATEDEGDVAYELDAIKYATWMKSPMDRGGGRIKNVWRWHYGVMWRNYLRSHSDSGDQPSENFDPEENPDDDLVVACVMPVLGEEQADDSFWRAIVHSPNAPPQLRLEPGQREPSDPGKSLRYPHVFECPHGQMRAWLNETGGKRLWSTYLQRQRWEREHPDEPVPKRLSDHYVYKKRLREKARAEAAGEDGRRFVKGGSFALKPKHKRKIREASSGDSEPEVGGHASRSVSITAPAQKDKREDGPSRAGSTGPVNKKEKKEKKEEPGIRAVSTEKRVKDGERSQSGSSDDRKEEKRKRRAEEEKEKEKKAKKVEQEAKKVENGREGSGHPTASRIDGNAVAGSSSKRATPVIEQPSQVRVTKASAESMVPPGPRPASPAASESSLDSIFNFDHEGPSQPTKKRKKRIESSPVDEMVPIEAKKVRTEEQARQAPTPLFTSSRSPSPLPAVKIGGSASGPSFGEPDPGIFDAAAAQAPVKLREAPPVMKKPAPVARAEAVSAPAPRVPLIKTPSIRPPPIGPSSSKLPAVRPAPAPPQGQVRPPAQAGLPARPSASRPDGSGSSAGPSQAVRPPRVRPSIGAPSKSIPTGPSATANIIRPAPQTFLNRTMHSTSAPTRSPVEPPPPALPTPPAVPSSSYVPRRPSYVQPQPQPPPQLQAQYLGQPWMQHPLSLPSPTMSISPIVSPHLPPSAELYKPAFDPRLRGPSGGLASPLGPMYCPPPGEVWPNIFDRRFTLTLPFRSKPSSFELSLAQTSAADDIAGAKLLNSLLFWIGEAREAFAGPLGSFEQSEACCLHGQVALGAKLRYTAWLNVIESSAGVGGQQLWDDLADRRGSAKVLACFTELVMETHISVHYALVVARADTIRPDKELANGANVSIGKLVFAVYEMPLDSRPPPMLPNPVRPFALLSHTSNTPPTSPRPVSIMESYGLADDSPIPLRDRSVLIYPGRDGPLDTLYAAVTTFCTEHGLCGAGDGRPAEVALFNSGKMSRVVRSTSIRQNLARRACFVGFGPKLDLYPSQWRATEVWQRGGLVTFSPTFILRSPERFAAITKIIRAADTWAAYVVPQVLKWCDDSWKQPARCPKPETAYDALVRSLPFDQQLARLAESDAATTGGMVVSCCPPVIHDTAGCERWITWLRRSSSSATYSDLVESCRGASSTGFSTAESDASAQHMALIDIETAQLDDLARMRSRPHLLPYRRYILVGEVSLDRKARDRYEAEIEFVSADDFTAVISGAV